MAGLVKDKLDLVARPAEFLGVAVSEGGEAPGAPVDLLVGEQRVIGDVILRPLAFHDAGGIVQHAFDQHAARLRHDHRRVALLAQDERQAPDVVEVAMGDDDEVQGHAAQRREIGDGFPSDLLRMQSAIDEEPEVSELEVERVRADAAVAIEVD